MKGRTLAIIMKKDLSALSQEKTIILAILLQLFVAMFSSFLLVGLTSLYDPSLVGDYSGIQYRVAYAGEDLPLRFMLDVREDIRVYPMELSPAIASLKERKVAAVIYVPPSNPDGPDPITITLYTVQNDIQSAVINVKLKEALTEYEGQLREIRSGRLTVTPVSLQFPEEEDGAPGFYEFVYGLLLPLLLFMPAVVSAALIIDLITEEYEHRTYETLLSAPVTMVEVVWGKILACFVLVPLQAGAWIILLMLNGIPIAGLPLVMTYVMVSSLILILVGALTGLHYRERTGAQVIFSLVVVVLMLVVLAIPGNPLNQVAVLASGGSGPGQGLILLVGAAAATALSLAVTRSAKEAAG
jgi:ABC-2 type transport system permease protein